VLVKLVEISVITPPVGMNLFAVMSAVDDPTKFAHVAPGVMPFIGLELIVPDVSDCVSRAGDLASAADAAAART